MSTSWPGSSAPYTPGNKNLERRVLQHKRKLLPGFTSKYNLNRLVHFETFGDIRAAIGREKQIKGWLRAKKLALILSHNPTWKDLSEEWFGAENAGILRFAQNDKSPRFTERRRRFDAD